MRRTISALAGTILIVAALAANAAEHEPTDKLVVHEWGTFTELHSLDGISVGGVNTDDEPVPDFVHRISNNIVQSTFEPWRTARKLRSKAVLWSDRIATRLETPVIYFYPPTGQSEPMSVDVDVQLRGGWLTEFYPNATVHAPGHRGAGLGKHAVGSLRWSGLMIGATGSIPETDDHVWLAPRGPKSARVVTPEGEAEDYLFYRGVGAFSGPLRVETDVEQDRLRLVSRFHTLDLAKPVVIPAAWLVEIQQDGNVAYRRLAAMEAASDGPSEPGYIDRGFAETDFSVGNLTALRADMHAALVEDGLYDDEATAMLATWDRAYFQSPGKRLFYVMPPEWTEDRMPLTLSVPATIDRVMMGRIELTTDSQIRLLAELGKQKPSSREWMKQLTGLSAKPAFDQADPSMLKEAGVDVPGDYAAYMKLGRFRNALVHNEYRNTKNANLLAFMVTHGLLTSELAQARRQQAATPPGTPASNDVTTR